MQNVPEISGVQDLKEFGRSTLVVGYKGVSDGVATIVEVLLVDDVDNRREFHRSSALQSRMSHPGMPPIWKTGMVSGAPYRVREFVEGRPASVLFPDGPLSEERLVSTGISLASTLGAMHRRGMVHTEVHPHGLRVESSGVIRFIDTGRAWPVSRNLPENERHLSGPYRAPEYEAGGIARPECDVFSLGALLLSLALGEPALSTGADFSALKNRPSPLSPAVRVLLKSMLDPDPAQRPEADTVADSFMRLDQLNALLRLKTWKPAVTSQTYLGRHAYPLVGRDKELRSLMSLWLKASKGQGSSITVLGVAGSGRRRLVEELRRGVQRTGGAVVRNHLEADPKQPTLIINLSPQRQAQNTDTPWLFVNFASVESARGEPVILVGELELEDCLALTESYLAAPADQFLEKQLKALAPLTPEALLKQLDTWCEEGVLKPNLGGWRFEPYDALPKDSGSNKAKAKSSKASVELDAANVQRRLLDLWPTNLEQDNPVLASLKSFKTVLKCQRVTLYRLDSGELSLLSSNELGEHRLDPSLQEEFLSRVEPVYDSTSLVLPLRCGVTSAGALVIDWSRKKAPKTDHALLQALVVATSPYALWLGKSSAN